LGYVWDLVRYQCVCSKAVISLSRFWNSAPFFFTILIEASTCAKQVRYTVLRRSFGVPELLRFPIFIFSKRIALRVNLNSWFDDNHVDPRLP
jgi:hypothetical protein